jgi:hypothetical protein
LHVSCQFFLLLYVNNFLSVSQRILLRAGVPKGTTRNRSLGQLMRMYSAIIIIGMAEFFGVRGEKMQWSLITGIMNFKGIKIAY